MKGGEQHLEDMTGNKIWIEKKFSCTFSTYQTTLENVKDSVGTLQGLSFCFFGRHHTFPHTQFNLEIFGFRTMIFNLTL